MERGYWIRSKPVYTALLWNTKATAHAVLAAGEGGLAVVKLFQQALPEQAITVFYSPAGASKDYLPALQAAAGADLQVFETTAALLEAWTRYLASARMGLRIYSAGTEKFMWEVTDAAEAFGILNNDVMKELTGSLARSVYCVHCKSLTHEVTSNIATCSGCGRHLFVRDHFSRRMGAYMGLMVDAENPGEVPEIEEIYP
jgi:dimethylamine monooxygenase subunit C